MSHASRSSAAFIAVIGWLLAACFSHAAAATPSSDLLIVLAEDGLSYTAQFTITTSTETLSLTLPEGVTPAYVNVYPLAANAPDPVDSRRLLLQSSVATLRYQHQYSNHIQGATHRFRITQSSLLLSGNAIEGTLPAQSQVTWIIPRSLRLTGFKSDNANGRWRWEDDSLIYYSESGLLDQLTLDYRQPDQDEDGVSDVIDRCSNTPAGWPVDAAGCAADGDGDGVADALDDCKYTPEGEPVDPSGCEFDFDDDGVLNRLDQCRSTPAGATVDAEGCEPDTDQDGVNDRLDQCSGTPDDMLVDTRGCAPDTDQDGTPDFRDLCLESPPGETVSEFGCESSDRPLVISGVTFATGSSFLSADARAILDRVALTLIAIDPTPYEVAAHTDDQGTRSNNQSLSQRRASAVRQYLMVRGVSPNRLTAHGYGESNPLVPNISLEARAVNRRVELRRLPLP